MKSLSENFKIILAGTCSTLIAIGLSRFIYTPILPDMQSSLNLTSTTMGILSSYNYFGYLIGSLIPIIWNFSNLRIIIVFSSIISVITIGLMGLTTNIKVFILLRFLCGISSALGFIFTISLMFNLFKSDINKSLQLYHFCGIGLGIIIGTITVWIVSSNNLFWNHQWMIIGCIGIVACIPIIFFIPKQLSSTNTTSDSIKTKLSNDFVTISLGYFFFGVGYIIFGTFISAIAWDSLGISSYQYLSWIVVGFFAIPSVLIWNSVSNKFRTDSSLFFSCSTITLGVTILFVNNEPIHFLIACMLYGLGVPGTVALILVEGKKRFIGNINISVAIMTTAFSIGQILGPYVSGILIDLENDYKSSVLLAIVCLLISSILMLDPKRFKK